jgi:glycerate 2-kinase
MPAPRLPSKSSDRKALRSRALLRRCFDAALVAVDGRRVTAAALAGTQLPKDCPVLAIGKAAPAMLAGAGDALGNRPRRALCISREDAARPGEAVPAGGRMLYGDHPVPGRRSLAAGRALGEFLDALPARSPLLCLISGGSSALVECLPGGVELADLERANRWLLGSGLAIAAVNQVRARLSCLKAGRLARRLAGRRVLALAISDVPDDDPAVIGSGLLVPAGPSPLPAGLPAWLEGMLGRAPSPPAPGDEDLAAVDYRIVANGCMAARAAAAAAIAAQVPARVHPHPLCGATQEACALVIESVLAGAPGLQAWFGETTVRLPADAGEGGRNSHLALACGVALQGQDEVVILCAGTDGSDGTSAAAGGWADGGVVARLAALGLDVRAGLLRADSGRLLAASGDALTTGPTGTNVMDLVLALRDP